MSFCGFPDNVSLGMVVSTAVINHWLNENRYLTEVFSGFFCRSAGRPKTNPLSRDEQLRINKRNQLKRDKVRGLKRVELKLNAEAVEALNELAESRNMSRSELIEEMLMQQLAALRSQGIV